MILTILAYIEEAPRIFYGLKENGRPFFNNGTTPYKYLNGEKKQYECETLVIKKMQNEKKEYLLIVGKEVVIWKFLILKII